ncbi:hypothetical protein [Sphingomonas sp.]|jgi:hypothetical protein|uniref:hypothetical protein n=1 Tax=Sphingomonas sp. TaxID=28214 RepID=UPI002E0FA8A1
MAQDRIVAVGFLTTVELAMLGKQFERHFPVCHDDAFDGLLARLDLIEASEVDVDVTIRPKLR